MPQIGAIAAEATQLDIVPMGSGAELEHEHQFVLTTIETSHAPDAFISDAHVFEYGQRRVAGGEQFALWRQSMQT